MMNVILAELTGIDVLSLLITAMFWGGVFLYTAVLGVRKLGVGYTWGAVLLGAGFLMIIEVVILLSILKTGAMIFGGGEC